MRYTIYSLVCVLMSLVSVAQDKYDNTNFDNQVATVLLQKNISIYDPVPIIALGGGEQLRLSFDMLSPNNEFFNYSIEQCSRNWGASNLQPMEYVTGNLMGEITDYRFSTNTYQKYTHYSLLFPHSDMEITKSGNYILKVYRNFDETDLVLTRRFMVVDNKTKIAASINSGTLAEYRFTHQEVDFIVGYEGFNIPNPFQDVHVTILQNNSWLNAIYNLQPQFVNNNELSFNYEKENVLPGTNEFRFFDIRSLRFFSNNVVKKYTDSVQNAVLRPEESKGHLNYVRWIDYNGKREINNADGVNIVEDGDYALIHFNLKSNDLSDQGDVYIYGELTDWKIKEKYKLKYWPSYGMYSGSGLFKQSYYNYHFVIKDKEGNIDYTFTEGNHQETENDYLILVYHKNVFYGYDELIGVTTRNSYVVKD